MTGAGIMLEKGGMIKKKRGHSGEFVKWSPRTPYHVLPNNVLREEGGRVGA
jgi:hypothetical protein